MTDLAPLLQGFFTDRLQRQRHASPHTIAAYRDAFTLLLQFATGRVDRRPAQLSVADLDAALITAFLQHLQAERGNSVATRNARLAAIHSFFGYAAVHTPEHAAVIQRVLAIPPHRRDRAIVNSSPATRPRRSSPPPTAARGLADVTTHCCSSPSTPGSGSPNSPDFASRTSTSALARTCAAPARDVRTAARP